jgi:hypothetical protein
MGLSANIKGFIRILNYLSKGNSMKFWAAGSKTEGSDLKKLKGYFESNLGRASPIERSWGKPANGAALQVPHGSAMAGAVASPD